jgi:hypothetical protein
VNRKIQLVCQTRLASVPTVINHSGPDNCNGPYENNERGPGYKHLPERWNFYENRFRQRTLTCHLVV